MVREESVLKMSQEQPVELQAERLLIEAAQRDPSRFAVLYENNFERVYAYVARRVNSRADAEDLTSHVFHRALANINRFEWRGAPFAAWLYRIAANAITDHAQHRNREPNQPDPDDADFDFSTVNSKSQQSQVEETERRALLFRMVNQLPEDQRRVLAMRFGEEKSIREIATDLKRSEGAIKQLQFRAIENLRTRMGVRNG